MTDYTRVGVYNVYDTPHLDTDSEKTNKAGYIEFWQSGCETVFYIAGNLPAYMIRYLTQQAIARGWRHFAASQAKEAQQ